MQNQAQDKDFGLGKFQNDKRTLLSLAVLSLSPGWIFPPKLT